MKERVVIVFVCLLIFMASSCSNDQEENKNSTNSAPKKEAAFNLSDYGVSGEILVKNPKVNVKEIESDYEQKLLKNKRIEIETEEGVMLILTESQENAVEMKVEFAEGFGETVVEKGEDYCIIQQEDEDGNPVYDVSVFYEKDGAFIEIKACDLMNKNQCKDIEQAKKGLKIAKTFKFNQ